jgi:(1->4)-alpha-D-glucan 1-alpha-D-glucosylmutase
MRARINVLSELPLAWEKAVCGWRDLNASKKRGIEGQRAPDGNDEYLFYQTVVGAWPSALEKSNWSQFSDRVREYMIKATREAKVRTQWIAPNAAYEDALTAFVDLCLQDEQGFVRSATEFQRRIAFFGRFNSLSQLTLKLTSPGVPDIYQGTELWDLSLVDPDNRRPVDYEVRRRLLRGVQDLSASDVEALVREDPEGRLKLLLLNRLLRFRRERRAIFESGTYLPLGATGSKSNHVCAFARTLDERRIVVIASVRVCSMVDSELEPPVGRVWDDTMVEVPQCGVGAKFRNVLTNEVVSSMQHDGSSGIALRDALAVLPVAVLELVT